MSVKLVAVAVFDRATGSFERPVFVTHRALAVRGFQDEVRRGGNSAENPISAHPDDFELHQVGFFDCDSGQFETAHEVLVRAADLKEA